MNKHAVSRRWFTEADVNNFKSGALRTTTNITKTALSELSVSQSRNAIYFPSPFFHEISFYYFRDTKLCAKHKKTCEFHLYCWDHVC